MNATAALHTARHDRRSAEGQWTAAARKPRVVTATAAPAPVKRYPLVTVAMILLDAALLLLDLKLMIS